MESKFEDVVKKFLAARAALEDIGVMTCGSYQGRHPQVQEDDLTDDAQKLLGTMTELASRFCQEIDRSEFDSLFAEIESNSDLED